jgi:zinc protease
MTQEAFEVTREFLGKFGNVLTQTQSARLGYALDSHYYQIPEYTAYMKAGLARLTLADVNAAIRRHLRTDRLRIVLVTKDGAAIRDAIVKNTPSPIKYNSPKAKEITDEDKIIESYKVNVKPEDIAIVPVARVFE